MIVYHLTPHFDSPTQLSRVPDADEAFGIEPEEPGHELHSYACPHCQRIKTAVRPLFH